MSTEESTILFIHVCLIEDHVSSLYYIVNIGDAGGVRTHFF